MPSDHPIPGKCGSPLRKKPGQFCTEWPIRGRERCRIHNGRAARGTAAPGYKHGNRSKFAAFVPEALRERHARFMADPEASELREEKAIAATVLSMQFQRIGQGLDEAAAGAALLSAQTIFKELLTALPNDDKDAVEEILRRLRNVLAEGVTAEQRRRAALEAEEQVRKTTDLRRKLAESEMRIIAKRQAMVTIEQLQALTFRFADLAAGVITMMESKMAARGIPVAEAAEIGRAALGEFAAELQQLVPPPEVN